MKQRVGANTNIGKLCPRCQRGGFFGPGVSGLQPLLPSLDAALCVLPQLCGSELSDVGPGHSRGPGYGQFQGGS